MSQDGLQRISERTISENSLRSEISKLEGVTEPASFWINIANDRAYSATHRAIVICQFVLRHMREPMDLVDLARLLDEPEWINSGTVACVDHLKGELPVDWNLGETVLGIRLFPGEVESAPVLYLRLSPPLEAEAFVQVMRSPRHDVTTGTRVLEAACGGWG